MLATVVRKTDQIRHGLGWLPPVVIRKLNDLLAKGINPTALASTLAEIEGLDQEETARFARVLDEQRRRILSSRSRVKDNPDQLLLELGDIADAEALKAVRRQVSDNWRYWERRLASIDLWPQA
ncbi:MAG: hypothetical protein KFB97_02910 [Cyanobium sp. M30B3]|nr:MAG: hypothetical protein KFB97_02910 [Cyanobium sp. M30B3]